MDEDKDKKRKAKAKELRRKMYLSAKERLKNDPVHQAKLLDQKKRMKTFRAEMSKRAKEKVKEENRRVANQMEESHSSQAQNFKAIGPRANPLDLLIQTGADSTFRPLGEIISIDFKKKVKLDHQP